MKKKIAVILCLVLGFTAAACGLSDAATEKEATETADSAGTSQEDSSTEKMTVNVGISMGVTGSLAASTEQFTVGIQAALQQLEEDGGLENYNIELHIEDDQSDIVQTVTNANKLIYDTGVNVIMGPTSATYALSIADIAEEEKIPMMPGSWTPSLTHSGYEYIVRVCPNDMTSSDTVMSYLVEELGYSNIALLYLNSEQGSTGLDYGNASLEEYGMEYSIAEAWNSGDTDMSGQILKIAETNPEAVVVWGGTASEMAIALEQLNQFMDESVTICASTMAGQPSVAELLDPSCLTGVVYFTGWNPDSDDEMSNRFREDFVELHESNMEPSDVGARGYDAMMILAQALNQMEGYDVGADDFNETLNSALHGITFEGLQGTYTFDENGDGLDVCMLVEIQEDGSHVTIY